MNFPILYAETHYKFKFISPRYYKKEPEMVADIPIRVIVSKMMHLPVLLIIKDADKYPVTLTKIVVKISFKNQILKKDFIVDKKITSAYFSKIFYADISKIEPEQNLFTTVKIYYQTSKKNVMVSQDNYVGLQKTFFTTYYSKNGLPFPKNWFAGDVHYHSNFTSDQVEFGADIPSTAIFAKAMGLRWFFVTDHSYDLDDYPDNYLKNDPKLSKWNEMIDVSQKVDSDAVKVQFGEEVSIGNSNGENVHMLAVNNYEFIHGAGDSAEKWFENQATNELSIIKKMMSDDNLFIAAHPFEKVPYLQKLTLNRGVWNLDDIVNNKIDFLQIINGESDTEISIFIKKWTKILLSGIKIYILAGNDAHGNFNFMRQIKIPFIKLFSNKKQLFGRWMTIFHHKNNFPIAGIKKHRIIISNGPFLDFYVLKNKKKYFIGEKIEKGTYQLFFDGKTSLEFGKIKAITLFVGESDSDNEKRSKNLKSGMIIHFSQSGYLRMELYTAKGYRTITNPIWIG